MELMFVEKEVDCELYKKRIIIDEYDIICHSKDIYSPVYYSVIKKWHLEDKILEFKK